MPMLLIIQLYKNMNVLLNKSVLLILLAGTLGRMMRKASQRNHILRHCCLNYSKRQKNGKERV